MRKVLTKQARQLRLNPTEAEKHLWHILRGKKLGVKFRRQTIIERYIVDFVCFEKKLIIEVDGGQHAESQHDKVRDEWLENPGFMVLRFWNNEVLRNHEGVIQYITEQIKHPPPNPPRKGGGKT